MYLDITLCTALYCVPKDVLSLIIHRKFMYLEWRGWEANPQNSFGIHATIGI